MSEKFQNKYRSESHRHPTWDYSANGMYFITLVTQNRDCIFGKIENDAMQLNNWGKLVETEWYKSFEIRTELFCNEFILMPNHLHAIVIIDKTETHYFEPTNENKLFVDTHGVPVVDTHGLAYLPSQPPMPQRKTKSISSFVAGFKSSVTTQINNMIDQSNTNVINILKYNINNKLWMRNYHDHIIRDNESYQRIKKYIINNPKTWNNDTLRNP